MPPKERPRQLVRMGGGRKMSKHLTIMSNEPLSPERRKYWQDKYPGCEITFDDLQKRPEKLEVAPDFVYFDEAEDMQS